ncbi:MAG: hypothetical protein HUK03_09025, partial [Bacteroidaceae bacterium]|nr:hypothetical protein [Bacteroidaceae bacterium]
LDMHYNELWEGEPNFSDLYTFVTRNASWSDDSIKTTFAAYMNYRCSDRDFNMPGVLLTDAVMFALGAAHLELGGDHMLCREYFPYAGCTMSTALKTRITRYYDFLVAYENLLRDGGTLSTASKYVPTDVSGTYRINGWEPQMGGITTIARLKDDCTVVHLLNFIRANSLSWRDMDGTMPAPQQVDDLTLSFQTSRDIKHVYAASPDWLGGAMQELDFTLADGTLTLTVPSLTYWTMLVLQEDKKDKMWDLGEGVFAVGNIKAEGANKTFQTGYESVKLRREDDGTYQGVVTVVADADTPGYGRLSFFKDSFVDWTQGRLGPQHDHTKLSEGRTDFATLHTNTEWLVPTGTWHFTVNPYEGTIAYQTVGKDYLGDYVYVVGNAKDIGWDYKNDATRLYRSGDGVYGGTVVVDGAAQITLYASTKMEDDWTERRIGPMSTSSKPSLSLNRTSTVDYGFDRSWTCRTGTWWMELDPKAGTFCYKRLRFFYAVGGVQNVGWNPDNTSVRLLELSDQPGVYQGVVETDGGDITFYESTRNNVTSAAYWTEGRWGPTISGTPQIGVWNKGFAHGEATSWTGIPAGKYIMTLDMTADADSEKQFSYDEEGSAILRLERLDPTDAAAYDLSGRPAAKGGKGIVVREGRITLER